MNRFVAFLKFLPTLLGDKLYLKYKYWRVFGHRLNLHNPKTFNEKIQWLKLYNRQPIYTVMVDKCLVKQYVANIIGEQYIIPTIQEWDSPEEIDFDLLPGRFVIKCNHNSSKGIYICHDKSSIDKESICKDLTVALNEDYFRMDREWPYKDVKRRILAEKYMEDSDTKELRDYKFFCFNGKVRFFKIDYDRYINHRANYYDINGDYLDFGEKVYPRDPGKEISMPHNLDLMIRLSEKLAEGVPFIRVDLYEVDRKVYFGELTFYPASGFGVFEPTDCDYRLGEMLQLPDKTTNK